MNIKVHTSVVLASCTLAGLLLGGLLVERYRSIDAGIIATGPNSVAMRTTEFLADEIAEWLVLNDSVLLEGQNAMLEASSRKAHRIRELLDELAMSPLAVGETERLRGIVRAVDLVEARVFSSRDVHEPEREQRLAALANSLQPLVGELALAVSHLHEDLRGRAEHRFAALQQEQDALFLVITLAALLYFVIVWLCWLWTVRRVVRPIELLSAAAARRGGDGELVFELSPTGPREVRQLTENFSSFVRELQLAKANTEAEVRARTAELVEASQAKGQFLATMSHELRTPLNGIINMNELMLETRLDAEQSGFARTAKNAAEALLALINDILDFSKIEARKLDLEQVETELRDLVDSAVEILAGVAEGKQLELTAVTMADVPQVVIGDPVRLRQVLINLLNNALKFTQQGSVTLRVRCLGVEHGHAALRFEVTDTGIGIPPERRASLFRAFEQVDASTTRKYGGTGLGLAICRELVSLMGGEIDVDSVEGEGSTFWFSLRLPIVAPAPTAEARDGTVLVLSGREAVVARTTEQLRELGVPRSSIVAAPTLAAAGVAASALPEPWLVLYDPYRRGTDGFAELHALADGPRTPRDRVAVLEHWLRHWPDEIGRAPTWARPLHEPTTSAMLTLWLDGQLPIARPRQGRPADRAPTAKVQETAIAEVDQGQLRTRGRVLVVDDTSVNLRVVQAILQRHGFTTRLAADGRQAVDAFARSEFDLILMDCMMPVMDGLEATRKIRELEARRGERDTSPPHVPIIALTTNTQPGFDARCFEAGMDHFLTKPCKAGPLVRLLDQCLLEALPDAPLAAHPRDPGGSARDGHAADADRAGVRSGDPARMRSGDRARVLVADDDAINRKVADSVLTRAGFEVVLVEDGQQAIDSVRRDVFDIVLMDCQMPVLDGLAASARIRELARDGGLAPGCPEHLPIVALTGNVLDSDRDAATRAGMDRFLTKPFRPRQLLEVVQELTGGRVAD